MAAEARAVAPAGGRTGAGVMVAALMSPWCVRRPSRPRRSRSRTVTGCLRTPLGRTRLPSRDARAPSPRGRAAPSARRRENRWLRPPPPPTISALARLPTECRRPDGNRPASRTLRRDPATSPAGPSGGTALSTPVHARRRRPARPRARPPRRLPCRPARHARGRRGPRHPRRHRELGQRRGPGAPDRASASRPSPTSPHPAVLRPARLPARARRGAGGGRGGRAVLHRPPARARRRRRPDGHRLARAGLAAVLPGVQEGPDGRRAAPPLRLHRRRPDRVRGRAPLRPRRGRAPPASCSSRRSSGRASARCATSWRRSSPSRTRSSGPGSAARSACRAAPAPGRPRSACTGSRTCSTRTASGSPAPAPSSSARTRPSCTTSSRCCPRWASWRSSRPPSTTWCAARRGARHGRGGRPRVIKGDARMARGAAPGRRTRT